MKKIYFLLSITTCLCACSPVDSLKPFDAQQADALLREHTVAKPSKQRIALTIPNKQRWKKIDLSQNKQGSPVMLIPIHESTSNWSESIRTRISSYQTNPDIDAKQMAQQEIEQAQNNCAHVTSKILSSNKKATTYRIEQSDCQENKNLTQIGKAFNGKDATYLVYYSAATSEIPLNEINKMTRAVQLSDLLKNPRYDER